VAYGLAYVLAAIPVTPGGLGVVEGVLVPSLVGFGATPGAAIVAVLGYRLVNFWLPIPVGAGAYLLSLRVGGDRLAANRREELRRAVAEARSLAPLMRHSGQHTAPLGTPSPDPSFRTVE
jgi:hypothetical protein